MNAKASAAYIKRILAREDARNETANQLRLLAERLYLQLPTFAIIRVVRDGNIFVICASDATCDTMPPCTNDTGENAENVKADK